MIWPFRRHKRSAFRLSILSTATGRVARIKPSAIINLNVERKIGSETTLYAALRVDRLRQRISAGDPIYLTQVGAPRGMIAELRVRSCLWTHSSGILEIVGDEGRRYPA